MTRRPVGVCCALIAIAVLVHSGCAHRAADDDLYLALGGGDGIARLVDAFLVRLAEDELVVDTFADTDIGEFRRLLIEQFCDLSGGPCSYSGRTMIEAHRGLGIEPAQFHALVEDLMQAMDDVGVRQGAQNRLLGLLAPMYREVLEPS